jgi:CHAD domain-containing protein
VISARSEELFANTDGVLDASDIERVHDLRVATRRLRAALEFFAPCLQRRAYKQALRRTKQLADALGERRDVDVLLEGLAHEPLTLELEHFIAVLVADQERANSKLARAIAPERLSRLRRKLERAVATSR